jgi:transposase
MAGRLSMTTHASYAWIKKFGPDLAEHNAMSDEQAETRQLKKELKRTTQQRDL